MTMKRWDGATWGDLTTAKRWDGASWVDLTIAKRWDGSTWVDIPLPGGGGGGLSATVSPAFADALFFDAIPSPLFRTLTTNSVTVTATGGSGAGPTYSWTRISGSSAINANSPTSATTSFTASVGRNQRVDATFRCTVTRGSDTVSVNVPVFLERITEPE